MAAVAGCGNTLKYPSGGIILQHRGDRVVSVDCPNMRIVTLRQRLLGIDPQFLNVRHFAQTPLFQAGQVDRTRDNLFIRHAHWRTFLAHFKWVVASKPPGFFVRVATDMTLLNVYVGNASVKNRLVSQREENGELLISNSLEDLLSSADLAIIRLGHIIHANRAAANVLREALMLRIGLGKPTWLVEPLEETFAPLAMPCCDENVLHLVHSTFTEIHLESTEEEVPAYTEDEDGVSVPGADPLAEVEASLEEDSPEAEEERAAEGDDEVVDAEVDALVRRPTSKGRWRPQPKRRR